MASLTKGKTFANGELVTPQKLHELVDLGTVSGIVNADIAADAAIADSKLAQITTANKVAQSAVTNLTTDLAGKAASSHTHTIANVTGLQTALDGKQASGSYAPATHTHTIANVTGLQSALDGKQAAGSYAAASHTHDDRYYTETEINTLLAGKQAAGSYVITTDSRLSDARTPVSHTHDDRYYTETEMNTLLAGKQAAGSYAPATGIAQSAVTNLTTDLAGKAASSHTHAISDTTGLQTALNGKQAAGSYAAASHTHDDRYYTETEMNTLLASKLATTATAAAATKLATARTISLTGDVTGSANFDGSANASITATVADDSHNHIISNVDGLQTALDGKQEVALLPAFTTTAYANTAMLRGHYGQAQATSYLGNNADLSSDSRRLLLTPSDSFSNYFAMFFHVVNEQGNGVGGISKVGTTGVAYNTSSDYRLKTNLEPLTEAVARLLQIPVHRFNWLADLDAPKVDGFLAHEAQAIVPESVTGHKDEVDAEGKPVHQGIDQSKLVPLLVAAVQELAARVAALEAR